MMKCIVRFRSVRQHGFPECPGFGFVRRDREFAELQEHVVAKVARKVVLAVIVPGTLLCVLRFIGPKTRNELSVYIPIACTSPPDEPVKENSEEMPVQPHPELTFRFPLPPIFAEHKSTHPSVEVQSLAAIGDARQTEIVGAGILSSQ